MKKKESLKIKKEFTKGSYFNQVPVFPVFSKDELKKFISDQESLNKLFKTMKNKRGNLGN